MLGELEYTGCTLNINGLSDDFDFSQTFDIQEGESSVIISSFDDLKDAFERLYSETSGVICVNSIGLLEMCALLERIMYNQEVINLYFVSYGNMDIANVNMINQCPSLESIEHLLAFTIASKLEQMRASINAAIEVFFLAPKFKALFDTESSDSMFTEEVRRSLKIHIIEMRG